jgi:hypothetical protein
MFGSTLAFKGWLEGGSSNHWVFVILLLSSGVALFRRTIWGTGGMVLVVGILAWSGKLTFDPSWPAIVKGVFSLAFLGLVISCLFAQIGFHRRQRLRCKSGLTTGMLR